SVNDRCDLGGLAMPTDQKQRTRPVVDDRGTDYLEPFIEATISAATRFRRVLLVIIVTSVLVFGAFWNARVGSWLDSRFDMANNAKEYFYVSDRLAEI